MLKLALRSRFRASLAMCALTLAGFAAPAMADIPGPHPFYLHGLSDLRAAHGYLDQLSASNVDTQELRALREIHAAYGEARHAAAFDGKNLREGFPVDTRLNHHDRLVRALQALHAAHNDFARYESNYTERGWQRAAIIHVDRAIRDTRQALFDQFSDRGF